MYSYGPFHMIEQKQDDQLEPTYSSSVRIRNVALRTCQKRWTIGWSGERGSGISVLTARHDDDDDDINIYIVLNICNRAYCISEFCWQSAWCQFLAYAIIGPCFVWCLCYEIAEGFRFMPLSLVRLRTFRLSTWVGWV